MIAQKYFCLEIMCLLIAVFLVAFVDYTTGVTIGFGEEDYSQMEQAGSVSVTVSKLQDNAERIVVNVIPLTFGQFASNYSHVVLPEEIQQIVDGVDPAELEAGRTDFDNSIKTVIFEPSIPQIQEQVSINIVDDAINEASEGFYIVIEIAEVGAADQQDLILERNGVALVRISDNDQIFIGFSFKEYVVHEDERILRPGPLTIQKENGAVSEQNLPVIVTLAFSQAVQGDDYNISISRMGFDFSPDDISFEIPFSVLDDSNFEPDEVLELTLSIPSNPPSGLNQSPTTNSANIVIIDDEVATIGFEQPIYTFREGVDTSVEVCFKIISPEINQFQIDPAAFATVYVEPSSGSALVNKDFVVPASYFSSSFLDFNTFRDCKVVELVNDSLVESTENFKFSLTLGEGLFDVDGNFSVVLAETTVVIEDDDGEQAESVICRIFEPLQVQPFNQSVSYRFKGTCEHIALSLCESSSSDTKFSVNVDFLSESMENGAVGLFLGDASWISREDGSFDDGDLEVQVSEIGENFTRYVYSSGVEVELYANRTTIKFSTLDIDEVIITHYYGATMPFIEISGNFRAGDQLCGLCGSHNGSLIKPDGETTADINNMAQVEAFAQSYLVPASDQSLRPQRRECGMLRNDTVIGDPLYAIPLYSRDDKGYSLCYEVFGRTNSTFNLVSDTCVSISAHYGPMRNPEDGNIINKVGVQAVGTSQSASCHNILVELEGCSASVQRSVDNSSIQIPQGGRYDEDGVSVRSFGDRVRIAVPNCENVMLVMYVICQNILDQEMIKFVITRGLNLRPSSHGLIGQFWNIPINFTEYSGEVPEGDDPDRQRYTVHVTPESSSPRSFVGEFLHLLWDKTESPCLYAGNAQGGPSYIDDPSQSVIEGNYREYIVDGIFETSYKYSRYDHVCSSEIN